MKKTLSFIAWFIISIASLTFAANVKFQDFWVSLAPSAFPTGNTWTLVPVASWSWTTYIDARVDLRDILLRSNHTWTQSLSTITWINYPSVSTW